MINNKNITLKIETIKGKTRFCLIYIVVFLMIFSFAYLLTASNAFADSTAAEAKGTFHQTLVSTYQQPMEQTYSYKFSANDPANPMPEGSVGNTYTFSMTGNTTHSISINYTQAGTYYYKCSLITPDPELENYVYDKSVKDVKVEISWSEDNKLFAVMYFANEEGEKTFDPQWTHVYNGNKDPDPEPEPDPPSDRPDSSKDFISNLIKTGDLTIPIAVLFILLLGTICGLIFYKNTKIDHHPKD